MQGGDEARCVAAFFLRVVAWNFSRPLLDGGHATEVDFHADVGSPAGRDRFRMAMLAASGTAWRLDGQPQWR